MPLLGALIGSQRPERSLSSRPRQPGHRVGESSSIDGRLAVAPAATGGASSERGWHTRLRWSNAPMGPPDESAGRGSSRHESAPGWGGRFETGVKPDVSQPRCGWALMGSAVLGVIGGLTPWAYVHGDEVHRTDIGVQVGWFTGACALVVAALSALIVLRRGQLWVSVSALALNVISGLIMIFVGGSISEDEARTYSVSPSDVSAGYGVWLSEAGALLGVVFAVWALRRRTATPAGQMY